MAAPKTTTYQLSAVANIVQDPSDGAWIAVDVNGLDVGISSTQVFRAHLKGYTQFVVDFNKAKNLAWRPAVHTDDIARAAAHGGTVVAAMPEKDFESMTDHEKMIHFIKNSYDKKPSVLKLPEIQWQFAIRSVLRGDNLMIRGDAGSGKTILAQALPAVFPDRPFFYMNLGTAQDARSSLVGNTHFKKDTGTYVTQSYFLQAIQTKNAIIFLDEVSRCGPDAWNILMPILDKNQRFLRIDEHPDCPTIKVAEGVTFISTANVGSEYTSTRVMDRAFLDRWSVLVVKALSKTDEMELLRELYPDLDQSLIIGITEIAEETRAQLLSEQPRVNTAISTRVCVEMAALCYDGFTLEDACELRVFPFYSDAGGTESPQTFLRMYVQQYLQDIGTPLHNPTLNNFDTANRSSAPWIPGAP